MGEFSNATSIVMRQKNNNTIKCYIENPHSDYKLLLDDIECSNESALDNINNMDKAIDKINKINPFEVENKFCIQRHTGIPRDIFKPEIDLSDNCL